MTTVAAATAARRTYAPRRLVPRGWPVYFFFASLPFAWLLGLANFVLPVYGMLLFFGLLLRDNVRLPARFGVWVLFLVCVIASALVLDSADRAFAYAYRTSLYLSATALFIYIFTSPPRELPTRAVVKALAFYWGAVVIGGFLGMAFPSVSLPSFAQHVVAPLLPGEIAQVSFVQDITTPGFADVQRILGFPVGRPKTFFNYTNEWASTLVLLTPFALLAMQMAGGIRRRLIAVLLVLSIVPLIFSLSRGAWIALIVLIVYASLRLAAQRNVRALSRGIAAVALAAILIFATPLAGLIESRLQHGHSDRGREARDVAALGLAEKSPLFGYGAPQPTATDPDAAAVGTHGQLFLVLVSHGIPAFIFFLGWFGYSLIRTATGGSSVRWWCHVVILVFLVMSPFYELSAFQLMVVAAAMALAWREIARSQAPAPARGEVAHAAAATGAPTFVPRRRAAIGVEPRRDERPRARRWARRTPPQRPIAEQPPPTPPVDFGRGDLSALARGGALGLAGGLAFAFLGFLLALVISHGLGAAGAGAFFEAVALFVILTRIAQIGADVGVVRMLPQSLALGRSGEVRQTVAVALVPVALAGAGIGGVLYLLAPEIAGIVANGTPPQSLVLYLRLWAPFLVLAALTAVMLAAARGLGSLVPFVSIENVGKPALQPLLALIAIAFGLGTIAVGLAWAIPVATGFVAAAWWLNALVHRVGPGQDAVVARGSAAALATEFWRFASPRAVAAFFQAVAAWSDIILVGALASVRAAGIYAAASRLVFMGIVFLRALILVLGPQISALLARNLRDRAQVVYQVSTWWLTMLSWPVYILLAVFATLALRVFGHEFAAGDKALVVLALAMLVSMACGPVSVVLLMAGKSAWNLFNTIFAATLGIGLNLVLIPRYGIVGAAIATAAMITANNLIPLAEVWRYLGLHPLGSGFLVVAGSALTTYGGIGIVARLLLGPTFLALVASSALATVAYIVLLRRARDTLKFYVIRDVVSRAEPRQ